MMKTQHFGKTTILFLLMVYVISPQLVFGQNKNQKSIDSKVQKFLDGSRDSWSDWNVPYLDGQVLHDLIVEKGYTSALEIGTSTGHSSIWIAWGLSKTGGKLISIEIDEGRYKQAQDNIKKAGLIEFVDLKLADAHELVKKLNGPFDFVFCDADKDWYKQYFMDIDPNLKKGGCFTAHNVRDNFKGIKEFLSYVNSLENYETSIDKTSSSGISMSFKKY